MSGVILDLKVGEDWAAKREQEAIARDETGIDWVEMTTLQERNPEVSRRRTGPTSQGPAGSPVRQSAGQEDFPSTTKEMAGQEINNGRRGDGAGKHTVDDEGMGPGTLQDYR